MIGTPVGEENMFGKMRGRFDVMLAERVQRTMPELCLGYFMAMDEAGREEFAASVNRIFDKVTGGQKWSVERKP